MPAKGRGPKKGEGASGRAGNATRRLLRSIAKGVDFARVPSDLANRAVVEQFKQLLMQVIPSYARGGCFLLSKG